MATKTDLTEEEALDKLRLSLLRELQDDKLPARCRNRARAHLALVRIQLKKLKPEDPPSK